MPYITIPVDYKPYQYSFDDILNGVDESMLASLHHDTHDTRTVYRETTPVKLIEKFNFGAMICHLEEFNRKYSALIDTQDKSTLYRSFKIPKRSGGLRPIDAPNAELMIALRELKLLLEKKLFASYHTCAFAYINGRCTIDAIKRHQANKSKWFLKLDFHNFFGSTTEDFLLSMLRQIFPYNEIMRSERGYNALKTALSLCFLNGGLPQGTPISPTLTNLMMIPIDYEIAKMAHENSPHLCYTRYADDIQLSSELSFEGDHMRRLMNHIDLQERIQTLKPNEKITVYEVVLGRSAILLTDVLGRANEEQSHITGSQINTRIVDYKNKSAYATAMNRIIERDKNKTYVITKVLNILANYNAPFTLSIGKTRYGSSAGRNWNLGVMLNKDNQITIGYQKKKRLKAAIFSFMNDWSNGVQWELADIQALQGNIAYARMVEANRIDEIISCYSNKFRIDLRDLIRQQLNRPA